MPLNAVTAPLATQPRVGLVASARPVEEAERDWAQGFRYEPEACGASGIYDPCEMGSGLSIAVPDNQPVREFMPYVVRAYDRCSSFGWASRDFEGRARRALLAYQSFQIEKEFWSGTLARAQGWENPYLTHLDSDVVTNGPQAASKALACLEGAAGECNGGQRLMIHAPRQVVAGWSFLNLLRYESGLILTANDNIVVSGAGYDGSGPQGAPDGDPTAAGDNSTWIYATDIVDLRLGEIRIAGAPNLQANGSRAWSGTNTTTNVITTVAERLAAATFGGCCLLAAETDVTLCHTGGEGS